MTGKSLDRYHSILDGTSMARYLDAKSLEPEDDSSIHMKVAIAQGMLHDCMLCERRCGVDRLAGVRGHCRVLEPRISSEFMHMGEEEDLIPSHTIFFTGCTFECVYCQNWDISTRPESGIEMTPSDLASIIKRRWSQGARNVNWVGGDPTSHLHYVLETLDKCDANIPQVWNSNMYQTEEAMELLDGVVDVYLSDFKYGNDGCAKRLSHVSDYSRIVRRNHIIAGRNAEMIIRHLVLPEHVDCCTIPILAWISENLENVSVNVMGQYRPEHNAREYPELRQTPSMAEMRKALNAAKDFGLTLV